MALTAALVVAAAVVYGGYRLNVAVGLDTPERRDSMPDNVFAIAVLVLAGALAFLARKAVVGLRAHLVMRRARRG